MYVADAVLLWLWCTLEATAPIGPLAWEPPYAASVALKRQKHNKKLSHSLSDFNSHPGLRPIGSKIGIRDHRHIHLQVYCRMQNYFSK